MTAARRVPKDGQVFRVVDVWSPRLSKCRWTESVMHEHQNACRKGEHVVLLLIDQDDQNRWCKHVLWERRLHNVGKDIVHQIEDQDEPEPRYKARNRR